MDLQAAQASLADFGADVRRMLEPGLAVGIDGTRVSAGSCLHATLLFGLTWNKFGAGGAWIQGGDGDQEMGALDAIGRWQGHYWCVVDLASGRFIVDITADQFGYPPVRVLQHAEAAGRWYRAGRQDLVDEAVADLAASLGVELAAVPSRAS